MANAGSIDNIQRLNTLRGYGIMDTEPEPAFDDITRLAAQICQTPIALVSFVDEGRQWFKSEIGLGVRETPLDTSFCAHAILQHNIFVVPDTTKDERFASNPLVCGAPHVRFYAGALLMAPDGQPLGTVCVLDRQPRQLSEAQGEALQALARQVMDQLELRRAQHRLTVEKRVLESLQGISADLSAELELDALLQKATDAATAVTGAKFGAFFYNSVDGRDETYQLFTVTGAAREDFEKLGMPRITGMYQPTLDVGAAVRAADITQDPRYAARQGVPQGDVPVRSYLEVPVVSRSGDVHGGLLFGHPQPGVFSELSEQLATGIAAQAAIAIDNARLYQRAQHELEERRRAQEALRASERQYRFLAEAMPQLVWSAEADGSCTYMNSQWYEFSGCSLERLLGSGWLELVHPQDRARAEQLWQAAVAEHASYDLEYRLRRADGEYRWFKTRGVPMRGDDGHIIQWFGTCTDITEIVRARATLEASRERLEQQVAERTRELGEANERLLSEMNERERAEEALRQSQKMEAIGQLTGGVAHDFNNLLQVVRGNLQLLGREVAAGEQAQRRLDTALSAVDRGAKLASQLLAFARRQPLEPKPVNVGRLLKGIDDLLRRALGETVEIKTAVDGGLWNTFADPAQMENVILNLAVNARDAMDGGGKLTIETSNAVLDDCYAARYADIEPGQYVMLAISDSGCGMSAEVLERVFEPFFTTKPEGRGTGLGLSMVYGFVKQSKGHIKLYSEVGQGTTVKIYLPRALQAEEVLPELIAGPIEGGSETVLVAEDDAEVRQTVVDTLTDLGYRVLKASDAQSALDILQSGASVDLLFTDVVMPGPLRAPELARQAKQAQPDLAVLFTSGYTDNAIIHGGRLDPGVELLSKPYGREQLARKLRHILRNREQRMALERRMAQRRRAVRSAEPAPSRAEPSCLRILLVEDDEHIREPTLEMLQALGHGAVAAASAEQALSDFAKGDFDVLFTDVSLPGISGLELAQSLVRQHADLRVIIASGYGREGFTSGLGDLKPVLLPKPYGVPELVAALEQVAARELGDPLNEVVDG